MLGHGGIVVFDDTVDMVKQAPCDDFCAKESCGKGTPCRIGAVRGREVLDRVCADTATSDDLILLYDLARPWSSITLRHGWVNAITRQKRDESVSKDSNVTDNHYEVAV